MIASYQVGSLMFRSKCYEQLVNYWANTKMEIQPK